VTGALVAGLLAGYGIAVPVGAIAVLIIGLSACAGLPVGAGAGLGAATADGVYATVAVVGGAAVAGVVRPIATPLRWLAAAVLLALAVRTAVLAWRHHRDPQRVVPGRTIDKPGRTAPASPSWWSGRPARAYLAVLGLTLLNPSTVVYFTALVLGRQAGAARSLATSVTFVVAVFVASASWQLLLAAGGSAVGRYLTGPRGRLVTALVSSALIAALAIGTI
jgi:arginine exporter protein ArgO